LSDNSNKDKKEEKLKRKINWSEHKSLLIKEAKCYLTQVFTELASRAKENEQRKGRSPLSISEFLDITAHHSTCVPTSIHQSDGFLRMMSIHIKKLKEVVPDFITIWWRVARMKINLDPKINPEKDDIVIAVVDSTGIKVTNRGEWILDKWKEEEKKDKKRIYQNTCSRRHKGKEDSFNVRNKRRCS
jgi:hypothetical protein